MISGGDNIFGPLDLWPFEATTRVCKPGALCLNPGFGFQKYKIWFEVGFFLHGLIASVKALNTGHLIGLKFAVL